MKLLKLFTFTFTLLIINCVLFANENANANTNNNSVLSFEIANKSPKHSFSANDARKLEKYLFSNNKITTCDQEALSLMLETTTGQQNIVQELYTIGYAVLELSCSQQNIIITLSKTPNDLAAIATHFKKQEALAQAKSLKTKQALVNNHAKSSSTDCNDCGQISLNPDILNEFGDASYSEQLIDFEATETTTQQVANMEHESNIFAVESENIVCDECEASLLTESMLDDAVNKLKNATKNELVEDAFELELENSSVYKTPNK